LRAEAGDVEAQVRLAGILESVAQIDEAEHWRRSAADADRRSGARELAGFLERCGDHAGSRAARVAAAQAGDYIAMRQVARMCEDGRALDQASFWWRRAVECGDLLDTLEAAGPDTWLWSDGVGGGNMDSGLARGRETSGLLDEASWMYQRAGEGRALDELARFLRRTGRVDEADSLLAFGIVPGGQIAGPW
jgi:hypothetical protein